MFRDFGSQYLSLWYSVALRCSLIDTFQLNVLVMIDEICIEIKDKSTASLQAERFAFECRTSRHMLETKCDSSSLGILSSQTHSL